MDLALVKKIGSMGERATELARSKKLPSDPEFTAFFTDMVHLQSELISVIRLQDDIINSLLAK